MKRLYLPFCEIRCAFENSKMCPFLREAVDLLPREFMIWNDKNFVDTFTDRWRIYTGVIMFRGKQGCQVKQKY